MKRNDKIELVLNYEEFRIMFYALNELRSTAIKENIDSIDIDNLMIKVYNAPKRKNIISRIISRKKKSEPEE